MTPSLSTGRVKGISGVQSAGMGKDVPYGNVLLSLDAEFRDNIFDRGGQVELPFSMSISTLTTVICLVSDMIKK